MSSHSNQAQANPTAEPRNDAERTISFGGQKMIEYCDHCDFFFAIMDVILMIAASCALGYLVFPFVKLLTLILVKIVEVGVRFVKEEISHSPKLYGSLALGTICIGLAGWKILLWTVNKCGKPGCKGIRNVEPFEYQIYTEKELRSSGERVVRDVLKEGMNQFDRESIKKLWDQVRRRAPPNGKAVMIHRAKCGCYIGRLEVAGARTEQPRGRGRVRR